MIAQFDDYDFTAIFTEDSYNFTETAQEKLEAVFAEDSFDCKFVSDEFVCDFGDGVSGGDYEGQYTVTPSQQTQTLYTANKTLSQNVTIKPIPQNYGLITYNGTYIKVS